MKHDFHNPDGLTPEEEPWTLGRSVNGFTLGEGQEWHRQDFTKEMLPEGWRPLLLGEAMGREDESGHNYVIGHEGPSEWKNFPGMLGTSCHMRTRRPLPPSEAALKRQRAESQAVLDALTKDNPAWVPWNGGECPLKDDEVIKWEIKFIMISDHLSCHISAILHCVLHLKPSQPSPPNPSPSYDNPRTSTKDQIQVRATAGDC